MRLLLTWLIHAVALIALPYVIPSITVDSFFPTALIVALVLGLINTLIRPLLVILTLPVTILTLGLFMFVINALMLMMTGWVSGLFNLGFYVGGFWDAFVGALIISLVSLVLSVATGARRMKVHVESRTLRS